MHNCLLFCGLLPILISLGACQKTSDAQLALPSLDSAHTIDANQLASDGAGPAQIAMGAPEPRAASAATAGPAFVTQTALVRRQAKDVPDLAVAGSKKRLSNFSATLYRGEQVEVVQTTDEWLEVRTSDGKSGWLKRDNVLPAAGVQMATVVNPAKMFTRPDLLAFNGAKTLMPGTLLFALRIKDQFSEVNLGGAAVGWILTDVLIKDKREVDVAKLINKARLLKDRKDPAADGLLELAKTHFGDTHLVQALLLAPQPAADPDDSNVQLGTGLPTPQGPPGLGAPGIQTGASRTEPGPSDAPAGADDAPVVPAGLPRGGVDTAPLAPPPQPAPALGSG